MLKSDPWELEREAIDRLSEIFSQVPAIRDLEVEREPQTLSRHVDAMYHFTLNGEPQIALVEFKASGQPRFTRDAIHQLHYLSNHLPLKPILIFVAPYLSEDARELCLSSGVGYADLEGNCRIVTNALFIDHSVATKPAPEKRELRSLFSPKSSRILRRLFRDPYRTWKVTDLAEESGVSLGLVSNVRKGLLAREWAAAEPDGLKLTDPDALLDAWRDEYVPPSGEWIGLYTPLHGQVVDDRLRAAMRKPGRLMLASFTAARWLAPYARGAADYVYADEAGIIAIEEQMEANRVSKGANLYIARPKENGVFRDEVEPTPGIRTTSPIQTYLDLWISGERGQEAAQHLREEKLGWPL